MTPRIRRRAHRWAAPAACLLLVLLAAAPPEAAGQDADATVVFLVRHAEKVDDGSPDPALTPEGRERARALSHELKDAGVRRIHSTTTRRTVRTAAPLARRLGVEVEPYDGGALTAIADRLRRAPGRHLVVGHSNTTPELVALLGGEPGPPIAEPWEYDRLYVVTLEPGGGVRTVLLRYGAPARPPEGSGPGAPGSGSAGGG